MSPTGGRLAADWPRDRKERGFQKRPCRLFDQFSFKKVWGPKDSAGLKRAKGSRLGRGLPFLCFPAAQRSGQPRDIRRGRCTLVGPKSEHVRPKSEVLASHVHIAAWRRVMEQMKTAARDDIVETVRSLARTGSQEVAIGCACFAL